VQRQCDLLGVPRSTYYYQPRPESAENLRLLRRLDELYLDRPFFGSRRMAVTLEVGRKRIQRLMRILGIEALYPKPNLSRPAPGHEIYPYLLRGVSIERPNQVWSTDITYLPMHGGFLYLVAVMDWFSRFVTSWELSNTMETGFCLAALEAALRFGQPEMCSVFVRWRQGVSPLAVPSGGQLLQPEQRLLFRLHRLYAASL
jgi:putative transposase